ncbi:MAG: YggS family pyridoxal phosphate-dependent enzyme [Candidatus Electrothrix sp. YB6]
MICSNVEHIRAVIRETALRCGRGPQDIELVAVSKRMPADAVDAAYQCGQTVFGENYLQDAEEKIRQCDPSVRWHFIGHLQSNKARTAAELFQMVETVDRLKIARALDKYAGRCSRKLDVLVQVNVGREPQKSGVLPEKARTLLREMQALPNLRVRGLMTMPPYGRAPDASRPWFRALRILSEELARDNLFYAKEKVALSMGMSGDFTVAIEEGATLVRVGTAIFGKRPA